MVGATRRQDANALCALATASASKEAAVNLQQVDLNLLVFLDALLREQNVTRAAERLNMSQPATSAALSRLRKMLGDELLVKHGRHLQLTPRGESLIDPVREVLAVIEQSIVRSPSFDPARDQRTFAINASDYVGVTLIRPLLGRLSRLAASLRIDLAPLSERYLLALQRDEVDIAVVPDQLVDAVSLPGCSHMPVISDRFVGAVWSRHPAANGRLTGEALSSHPYLQYRAPSGQSVWDQDLDRAGIDRMVEATASSFVAMPFMLAGTELIALLPESLGRRVARAADIVLLEPDVPITPLRQSAYWHSRRDRDPGHVWLREQLRAVSVSEPAETLRSVGMAPDQEAELELDIPGSRVTHARCVVPAGCRGALTGAPSFVSGSGWITDAPEVPLGYRPARMTLLTSFMSYGGLVVPGACRPSTGLCATERRSVSDAAAVSRHQNKGALPTGISGEEAVMKSAPSVLPEEAPNGLTCGIDWARDDHAVAVVDARGRQVHRCVVEHSAVGLRALLGLLGKRGVCEVANERRTALSSRHCSRPGSPRW